MQVTKRERQFGCFFGGIVGDSLGGPVEFQGRDTFEPVTDLMHNWNFNLASGSFTDDTSMMLCLAQSLIDNNGVLNKRDNLEKYFKWYNSGYMSVNNVCFDIGKGTQMSVRNFHSSGVTTSICSDKSRFSGNGSIMRLNPVPIKAKSESECINNAVFSSETTHSSIICLDACKYMSLFIYYILQGIEKDKLIDKCKEYFIGIELCEEMQGIYNATYKTKSRDDLSSSGYVINTLECALYSFFKFDNYNETVLWVVNLGDDADTVACVTGQIAGAYYGILEIKESWITGLQKQELLWQVARDLIDGPVLNDGK